MGSRRHHKAQAELNAHGISRIFLMPAFAISVEADRRLHNGSSSSFGYGGRLTDMARNAMEGLPVCASRLESTERCLQGDVSRCSDACVHSWFGRSSLWRPDLPCEHHNIYTSEQTYTRSACHTVPGQTLAFLLMLREIQSLQDRGLLRADELVLLLEDDVMPQKGWLRGLRRLIATRPAVLWHLAKLHGDRSSGNCLARFGTAAMAIYPSNASAVYDRLKQMEPSNVDYMLDFLNFTMAVRTIVSRERLFWPYRTPTTHHQHEEIGGCGVSSECARAYDASSIRSSPFNDRCLRTRVKLAGARAAAACERIERKGRERKGAAFESRPCFSAEGASHVPLRNGSTYLLPRSQQSPDAHVVSVLTELLRPSQEAGKPATLLSLGDLGAGVGQYGRALQDVAGHELVYYGWDVAGNAAQLSDGVVRFADLSRPNDLPQTDWVLSLDVGHHIPSTHEKMYIENLHSATCRGIILSWAAPGSSALGGVNNHGEAYLKETFSVLGYRVHHSLTHSLRSSDSTGAGHRIAFERISPNTTAPCANFTPNAAGQRLRSRRWLPWMQSLIKGAGK